MKYDDMLKDDAKHRGAPERGDFWHEMFAPILVVLDVSDSAIVVCCTPKATDKDRWTWDMDKIETIPRDQFATRTKYGNVAPRSHVEFSDYFHAPANKDDIA